MLELLQSIPRELSVSVVLLSLIITLWKWHIKTVKESSITIEAIRKDANDRIEAIRKESYTNIQETQTYWEERYDTQAENHRIEIEKERAFYQPMIRQKDDQIANMIYNAGKLLKIASNSDSTKTNE